MRNLPGDHLGPGADQVDVLFNRLLFIVALYSELQNVQRKNPDQHKDQEQTELLAAIGRDLRQLHLMESIPAGINSLGISYVGQGNDVVDDYEWHDNTVWINKDNCFRGIAEDVWTYYVGGYQPMQRWLQYRRKRRLTSDEILHFERMAYAIRESINLIKKLDEIDV